MVKGKTLNVFTLLILRFIINPSLTRNIKKPLSLKGTGLTAVPPLLAMISPLVPALTEPTADLRQKLFRRSIGGGIDCPYWKDPSALSSL